MASRENNRQVSRHEIFYLIDRAILRFTEAGKGRVMIKERLWILATMPTSSLSHRQKSLQELFMSTDLECRMVSARWINWKLLSNMAASGTLNSFEIFRRKMNVFCSLSSQTTDLPTPKVKILMIYYIGLKGCPIPTDSKHQNNKMKEEMIYR